MNLRDLLKALHAVDEKHLDVEVLVSPASGGYEGISHVSVLYVGHPVIHLAEPKPAEPPPDLWESQEGDVAAVNPADLKNLRTLMRDVQAQAGGQCVIDTRIFDRVCSPSADVQAVWYRVSMLGMMKEIMPELLARWMHDGQPDDAVFQVAATFPMEKLRAGVVREGPPFDVEEFVRQIGAQT
jgi:hypothetical protein